MNRFEKPAEDAGVDPALEQRLRDAFGAKAHQVTPESLHYAAPPPAPERRRGSLFAVAAVGAAAATAVGVVYLNHPQTNPVAVPAVSTSTSSDPTTPNPMTPTPPSTATETPTRLSTESPWPNVPPSDIPQHTVLNTTSSPTSSPLTMSVGLSYSVTNGALNLTYSETGLQHSWSSSINPAKSAANSSLGYVIHFDDQSVYATGAHYGTCAQTGSIGFSSTHKITNTIKVTPGMHTLSVTGWFCGSTGVKAVSQNYTFLTPN